MTTYKKFFASKQAGAVAFTAGLILAVTGSVFASSIGSSLSVSGTAGVTGLSTFTGGFVSAASSTVNNTFVVVSGNLTTLGGGMISQATSTVVGDFYVGGGGRVSIGSSTPGSTVTINGSLMVASSTALATTTITVDAPFTASNNTTRGGCINLRATDGTMIRIYATSSPTAGQSYLNGGPGTGFGKLVVEAGSCQ